uniref:lipoyl(octanoyl) transferase n=1 Tax=Oryza rufipogon TaxID=4529 RepID=A0A0E0NUC1_ORYRU
MSGGARRVLEAWRLGVVRYGDALGLQERLVTDRRAGRVPDLVLSLQHPPTYTLGKRRTDHNLLLPEADLRALGADIHRTERGGDVTFHGPRQAVLYPILSLRAIGLGARRYVEGLESAMIEVAALYGVQARPGAAGETGVWVGDRKIGAIGVRISSGFTCHGLAFNIDPDLGFFEHIVPCGIADKEVTSLRREAAVELPPDEVIHDQLVQSLARTFCFSDVEFKDESECADMESYQLKMHPDIRCCKIGAQCRTAFVLQHQPPKNRLPNAVEEADSCSLKVCYAVLRLKKMETAFPDAVCSWNSEGLRGRKALLHLFIFFSPYFLHWWPSLCGAKDLYWTTSMLFTAAPKSPVLYGEQIQHIMEECTTLSFEYISVTGILILEHENTIFTLNNYRSVVKLRSVLIRLDDCPASYCLT